jgi:NAD(P)-dependent dehydrogenase (short-subunit alcohol dehydrogenase family)
MPKAHRRHEPRERAEPKPPFPEPKLEKPGFEADMKLGPRYQAPRYKAAGKLEGRVALITGGDSGIGRAVAVLYAREGADVAIAGFSAEREDTEETRRRVEAEGRRCLRLEGDIIDADTCRQLVEETVARVRPSRCPGQQRRPSESKEHREGNERRRVRPHVQDQRLRNFRLVNAALPHLPAGSAIIVTGSETGFEGPQMLPDYSASKGAIHTLTKSLAKMLAERGIRVNCVAPGPVWTPLNLCGHRQSSREGRNLWRGHTAQAARPGRRARPCLRVPGVRHGLELHNGRGASVMGGGTSPG